MTPGGDFIPVGEEATGSHPLQINFDEQQFLAYEMRRITQQLEFLEVQPTKTITQLGRVPLLNRRGERTGNNRLGLSMSEQPDRDLANAVIELKVEAEKDKKIIQTIGHYTLLPYANLWEVIPPFEGKRSSHIESTTLLAKLSTLVRKPDIFAPLMDSMTVEGIDIARLLAQQLYHSAPQRRKKSVYETAGTYIEADSLAPLTARLGHHEFNNAHEYGVELSTVYELGNTAIQKRYAYSVEVDSKGSVQGSKGFVEMKSYDGYSPARLTRFARADAEESNGLSALHSALEQVEAKFDTGIV